MTQLQAARKGIVTAAMKIVAADENVDENAVREAVASGEAVIPLNIHHRNAHPVGVGRMFTTKINANLGRSVTHSGKGDELEKLKIALDCKADFVMDLSVGSDDLKAIRQGMLDNSSAPLGTVPVYETISRLEGDIPQMDPSFLLDVIRAQAEQGVDFMTLHAGLLLRHIPLAMKRIMGIVSRGGAIMAEWMLENNMENPLYVHWDEVLGELVDRCRERGVQVMVEGPGHVPFNDIQMNMERQQRVCHKAPFYVLGPVTTDIAPGYDHIVSAIGATAAATYGASLLCYVTPAEHLGLPDGEEVRQGCIAYKIAAHAGDVARNLKGARERDDEMSRARAAFDWDRQFALCLDPERARARWLKTRAFTDEAHGDDHCSMCGKQFCAVRTSRRIKKLAAAMAERQAQ